MISDIEAVELTLWSSDGNSVSIDLEPWQVKAIVTILGLSMEYGSGNTYNIEMLGEKGVKMMLDKLPKLVKLSEIEK